MVETREVTKTCQCGAQFQAKQVYSRGVMVGNMAYCPACVEIKFPTQEKKADDDTKERWQAICPPLYDDTHVSKLSISPETIAEVLAWTPNPRGLGLSGPSGAGKTRLMFLLLKQLHDDKHRMIATSAKKFENWCHRMFDKDDDARVHIKAAHDTRILFIDDIGKEKYTERVESEFYDLIEDRTAHKRPILWTTNATGDQLKKMLGDDRGVPIVRRLREFTEIISV